MPLTVSGSGRRQNRPAPGPARTSRTPPGHGRHARGRHRVGDGGEAPRPDEAVDEGDVRAVLAGALDAAPRPQRSYLVYFEQGSADLTPESEAVFETALQDALETEAARVTVFGHTDRQGSAALNVRLAQQRAEAMRLRLVDAGIDAAAVEADSFGESFPLVATADGVAEARNSYPAYDAFFARILVNDGECCIVLAHGCSFIALKWSSCRWVPPWRDSPQIHGCDVLKVRLTINLCLSRRSFSEDGSARVCG